MNRKSVLSAAIALAVISSGIAAAVSLPADAAEGEQPYSALLPTQAVPEFTLMVNGTALQLDAAPRMSGSTMLVPVRSIAEALGAQVEYDEQTGTVTAVKGAIRVELRLGSAEALRNGSSLTLSAPPVREGNTILVPLRFFSEAFETAVKWDGAKKLVSIDSESYLLPAVGSLDNLKELLKQTSDAGLYDGEFIALEGAAVSSGFTKSESLQATATAAKGDAAAPQGTDNSKQSDYSSTNVQVQGVDEADVVKTDGEYIYQVNGSRIVIARTDAVGSLGLESVISLADAQLNPLELYVDGDRLIVIGSSYEPYTKDDRVIAEPAESVQSSDTPIAANKMRMIMPFRSTRVKTVVYDIADRKNPKAVKELETEGNYVTSRKIGSQVYVIANHSLDRYSIMNEPAVPSEGPAYKDSSADGKWTKTAYQDIRYFPDSPLSSYMLVAGIDTEHPDKASDVSVYLGSAQNIYASLDNLYTAVQQISLSSELIKPAVNEADAAVKERAVVQREESTVVYKFLLQDGKVRFTAKGVVPGSILNQFSMDENNGYFRIATTKGNLWGTGEQMSKNNLYILDEAMNLTGKIEDIAPGEKIYSVRFMGNRGYMVTFKKVDPLFVLDLSNPSSPSILGKLKIPGYSDYLHPYDENHLIGFGKDAVEVANEWDTTNSSTTAYYQGMKVSMFDVTDVSRPKELFQTVIGDRGTDSELLNNHKALLFSKEKNLLAFPITVMEVPNSDQSKGNATSYGQFAFQGAYVYHVDLTGGFKLRGSITHLTPEEEKKAGGSWYGGANSVERLLYIGDTLYTLSKGQIRANALDTLDEKNRLILP
jgi:inhibitor of cysteine peptidase